MHPIDNKPGRLAGITAALTLGLCAMAAQAGDVVATASRNLDGSVSNPASGPSTAAYWPNPTTPEAWAISTRTFIAAESIGAGSATNNQAAASGTSWTAYTLWNLASDTALDAATAATLDLDFNYRVQGLTTTERISTSVASTTYLVELYSSVYHADGAGLTMVYGPVPPFPSEDYRYTGDTRLIGDYDLRFAVQHENATGGMMWMAFSGSAANTGHSVGTLSLQTITFAANTTPINGLGVKLETGQIIPVSAVPEPGAWLMGLAGAAWMLARQRRRATAALDARRHDTD